MTRERTRIAKDWKDWRGFQMKIYKSAQTTHCELKLIQDSPNTTWLLFLNFVVDVSSNKGAFWLCVVKNKTKVITTANEKKGKYPIEPMRTQSKFESDWLREWCEFLLDQSQRSKAKPMQSQMTFDTYLRISLNFSILNYFRSFSYSQQ